MTSLHTPEQVLEILRMGNERWIAHEMIHPHRNPSRREITALLGQKPMAAILTCSDSRVEPVVLFDQGLGDLFVVRVAGNIAGPDVLGSLAFAVFELEVPLVLVLGHTACGAITAAMGGEVPEGAIRTLVEKLRPLAAQIREEHPGEEVPEVINRAVYANVHQVLGDILEHSPVIRTAWEEGRVRLAGAVYDLKSGHVDWFMDEV